MAVFHPPAAVMHVPKSAGISLRESIRAVAGEGAIADERFDAAAFGGPARVDALKPHIRRLVVATESEIEALRAAEIIFGHFSLSTLLQVTPAGSIATVLREPRARLLSQYAFSRTQPGLEEFDEEGLTWMTDGSLEDFLDAPQRSHLTDNVLARMLLTPDPRLPSDGFMAAEHVSEVVQDALARLESLGGVGVMEIGTAWGVVGELLALDLEARRDNVSGILNEGIVIQAEHQITEKALVDLDRRTAADRKIYLAFLSGLIGEDRAETVAELAFLRQLVRFGEIASASFNQSAKSTLEELERHREALADIESSRSWQLALLLRRASASIRRMLPAVDEAPPEWGPSRSESDTQEER